MIPNPGSLEAQDKGCQCPIVDNHYGEGIVMLSNPTPRFWIAGDCKLHAIKKVKKLAKKNDKKTKKDGKRVAGY